MEHLDSWKAIAAYLRRTVRTVQRWELQSGLPVRRHMHEKAPSVYAFTSELDAWWRERSVDVTLVDGPAVRPPCSSLAGVAGAAGAAGRAPLAGSTPVILVLPFADVSPDQSAAHICRGFVEELITAVGSIEGVRVPSWLAVSSEAQAQPAADRLAEHFRAALVVEGSVRKIDDRSRVLVRVTRPPDGGVVWSQSFEARIQDLLSLEERIVAAVVRECGAQGQSPGVARAHSGLDDAYDLYLMAVHYFNTRTVEGLRRSISFAMLALERDPSYALAAASLAVTYMTLASYTATPPGPLMELGREAALRALALDPNVADAHMALAFAQLVSDWDLRGSEASFTRALALQPMNPTCHQWASLLYLVKGDFPRAIALCDEAERLDPSSPIIACHEAWLLHLIGRVPESVAILERTRARKPDFWRVHFNLGFSYLAAGRPVQAVQAMEEAARLQCGYAPVRGALAALYCAAGRVDDADRFVGDLLSQPEYVSPYWLAVALTSLGRTEQAIAWLRRSCDDREWYLILARHEPLLAGLRPLSEFGRLFDAMGL